VPLLREWRLRSGRTSTGQKLYFRPRAEIEAGRLTESGFRIYPISQVYGHVPPRMVSKRLDHCNELTVHAFDVFPREKWLFLAGIVAIRPVGSLAGAERFRAGGCLSGQRLLFPRRTHSEPRPERFGQILSFHPEGDESVTTGAVNDRSVRRLRVLATPQKPDKRGLAVVAGGCTQYLLQRFEVFHCRKERGPPIL